MSITTDLTGRRNGYAPQPIRHKSAVSVAASTSLAKQKHNNVSIALAIVIVTAWLSMASIVS
ncbi:MAG: hypothetical protein F6J87_05275 [Spirulina sp. SIO3F2]|nr:hypothetical protein [Spirulina sp. SIO3F2]